MCQPSQLLQITNIDVGGIEHELALYARAQNFKIGRQNRKCDNLKLIKLYPNYIHQKILDFSDGRGLYK